MPEQTRGDTTCVHRGPKDQVVLVQENKTRKKIHTKKIKIYQKNKTYHEKKHTKNKKKYKFLSTWEMKHVCPRTHESWLTCGSFSLNWSAPKAETLGLIPPVPSAIVPNAIIRAAFWTPDASSPGAGMKKMLVPVSNTRPCGHTGFMFEHQWNTFVGVSGIRGFWPFCRPNLRGIFGRIWWKILFCFLLFPRLGNFRPILEIVSYSEDRFFYIFDCRNFSPDGLLGNIRRVKTVGRIYQTPSQSEI